MTKCSNFKCTNFGGEMEPRELPYLTAPSGTKVDSNGVVESVTDTGMKIHVLMCPSCERCVIPPGSRPYYEN